MIKVFFIYYKIYLILIYKNFLSLFQNDYRNEKFYCLSYLFGFYLILKRNKI